MIRSEEKTFSQRRFAQGNRREKIVMNSYCTAYVDRRRCTYSLVVRSIHIVVKRELLYGLSIVFSSRQRSDNHLSYFLWTCTKVIFFVDFLENMTNNVKQSTIQLFHSNLLIKRNLFSDCNRKTTICV